MLVVLGGPEAPGPSLWPFVTFFFCGTMIDLSLRSSLLADTPLADGALMLGGVALSPSGPPTSS